jgi:valyl-tRNA synthetase
MTGMTAPELSADNPTEPSAAPTTKTPPRFFTKTYDPGEAEPRIYQFWLESGFFTPDANKQTDETPFTIALPPPNITGELHIGHALCYLAQDIVGRRARMQGHPTLLLPGMDHAGIATQNVVERLLAAEGLSRHDLGRQRFEERCWAFVNATMPTIRRQFQRLGFSFDWSRERFTLDEGYRRAVNRAFAHFFRKGWIYRGFRLVNWCPRCATSISDLEVEHIERQDILYTIEYRIADPESLIRAESSIQVATTRPETMLGDSAVAVHPADSRYTKFIGRYAILPLLGRSLPIVADEAVDPDFGTGAVKVTPAHDPLDYDLGKRHGLEYINVVGEDGRMTDAAGAFAGLSTIACRQAVLEELGRQGHLIHQEPYSHSVGTCERCHTVIEPLMSRQWFMKMDELAAPALHAVRAGRVRIEPERWERVYLHWMENIRDWCISRQLWWGHRIPVWICADCGAHSTLTADETAPSTCQDCGSAQLEQETDVLDTWFSSALWPFASLGWPDETEDLERFYPGHFLGTAGEIIFLWVARMIMEGLEFKGQEPFSRVYINPTVLAEDGQRMSKSLGTGVDPMIACDTYGADAIRWALIRDNTLAQTVRFATTRADEGRRFANKLWNAARFVLSRLNNEQRDNASQPARMALPDRWILSRLTATTAACDAAYSELRFDLAAQALYEFLWGEFCDWYLEIAKRRIDQPHTQATLRLCLDRALRLLHPLMPYVTEEIWRHLESGGSIESNEQKREEALMVATWPEQDEQDEEAENRMGWLMTLIRGIRNARAELRVPVGHRIPAIIDAGEQTDLLTANLDWLAFLAHLDENQITIQPTHPQGEPMHPTSTIAAGPFICQLSLLASAEELPRLQAELEQLSQRIAHTKALLDGEFSRRAPATLVQRERAKLADLNRRRVEIQERLGRS